MPLPTALIGLSRHLRLRPFPSASFSYISFLPSALRSTSQTFSALLDHTLSSFSPISFRLSYKLFLKYFLHWKTYAVSIIFVFAFFFDKQQVVSPLRILFLYKLLYIVTKPSLPSERFAYASRRRLFAALLLLPLTF